MTQQQLANRVFMSKSQISDYENKRFIMTLQNAKILAYALGCRIEDLYEWHYRNPEES